jgi:hypothetical protein
MKSLSDYLSNEQLLYVPLVFDPLSARIAQQSGFNVLYVGGAARGYVKCVTEANLGLTELIQAGSDRSRYLASNREKNGRAAALAQFVSAAAILFFASARGECLRSSMRAI